MDRFIEPLFLILIILTFYLKSNMDRFIVARSCASVLFLILFKIQYG